MMWEITPVIQTRNNHFTAVLGRLHFFSETEPDSYVVQIDGDITYGSEVNAELLPSLITVLRRLERRVDFVRAVKKQKREWREHRRRKYRCPS